MRHPTAPSGRSNSQGAALTPKSDPDYGPAVMTRVRKRLLWVVGIVLVLGLWIWSRQMCIRAYLQYGMIAPECPSGSPQPRGQISASSLRRGNLGYVRIAAVAYYTTGPADQAWVAPLSRVSGRLFLVDGKTETELSPHEGWKREGDGLSGEIRLPEDLKDGDYLLRARLETALGTVEAEANLPVYAPAQVHLLTDRPLYEPGNTVLFRALVVRARDLVPLELRPGRFVVTAPSGEVLLEEKAPAGEYGVAAGNFPLDGEAETGTWTVEWRSGNDLGRANFTVEPFTLPRFRVEVQPNKPHYGRGDRPELSGRAVYSSGAPVPGAILELSWSVSGAWPPPTDWLQDGLPKRAKTDATGRFVLKLPPVPNDLVGQASLQTRLAVTDATGDRVEGGASLLLSKDPIRLDVVTEFAGGLVEGFNNRVYLRATTASGTVLPKTQLLVKRAWEAADPGIKADTDEDGVASIQLDPGPAVNVVIPGLPIRPPPRPPTIERTSLGERLSGEEPSLAEQLEIDGWNEPLKACQRLTASESEQLNLYVRVAPSGQVLGISKEPGPLAACFAKVIEGRRLPPGEERLLELGYQISADVPRFVLQGVEGAPDVAEGVEQAVASALRTANECLPNTIESQPVPYLLIWRHPQGAKELSASLGKDPAQVGGAFSAAVASCLAGKLAKIPVPVVRLEEEGEEGTGDRDRFGWARFSVQAASAYAGGVAPDTVQLGYELWVHAKTGNEVIGETKIFVGPGSVPDLRLRTQPTSAKPGEVVELTVLRGPNFQGELPEDVYLSGEQHGVEAKLDKKSRTAKFQLPENASGWYTTSVYGAQAMVYVRPQVELKVEVRPEHPTYTPGAMAKLRLRTTANGKGQAAGVGLFGVDDSLSQLVALPGPGELSHLRPQPPNQGPAFGVLDVEALALGRIKGENALAATILRVNGLPSLADLDSYVSASGEVPFDPLETLTDRFYLALGELYAEVRAWEQQAPKEEQMQPALLAKLWKSAVERTAQKGTPATDAYQRPLRLSELPADLLALTDPRMVVVDGTRLPEDVENWPAWVAREKP